ncbi:ABC transporter substrate-binding protein [Paenibacillus sinopodophylli]|uniref:ABC transporter substrate-binding protein n=1 Tax=Paenibacillus sinopodophylli TaxID=1837342 RepID=UPI00110CCDF5|nr:extracellular solute-binding protein [Paenibacillus sinopodophylli]
MKKKFKLAIVLALGMSLLSACGSSNENPVPEATEAAGTTEAKTITLRWMHHIQEESGKAWIEKSTEEFTKLYPNVEFELTAMNADNYNTMLKTKLAAGDAPDIFDIDLNSNPQFVENGYMAELTGPFLDNLLVVDKSKEGKTYALRTELTLYSIYYNKDAFAKAGIESPPTTWAEFMEACEKLKAAGIIPVASGYKDSWTLNNMIHVAKAPSIGAYHESWTQDLKSRKTSFVDDQVGFKDLLNQITYIYDNSQSDPLGTTWDKAQDLLVSGEAAMIINGSWLPGNIRTKDADANLGTFPYPWSDDASKNRFIIAGEAKNSENASYGGGYGAYAKSPNKDMAVKFIEYLGSVENGKIMQDNRKTLSNAKNLPMDFEPTFDSFAQAQSANEVLSYGAFQMDFGGEYDKVFYDEIINYMLSKSRNADETLKNLDAAFDRVAKK